MPAEPSQPLGDYSTNVVKALRSIYKIGDVEQVSPALRRDFDWVVTSLRTAIPGVAVARTGTPGGPPVLSLATLRFWLSWSRDGKPVRWCDAQNRREPELLLFLDAAPHFAIADTDGLPVRDAAKCLVAALEKLELIKATRELFVSWVGISVQRLGAPQIQQPNMSRVLALALNPAKVVSCVC